MQMVRDGTKMHAWHSYNNGWALRFVPIVVASVVRSNAFQSAGTMKRCAATGEILDDRELG